jgi:hypothetical protein
MVDRETARTSGDAAGHATGEEPDDVDTRCRTGVAVDGRPATREAS